MLRAAMAASSRRCARIKPGMHREAHVSSRLRPQRLKVVRLRPGTRFFAFAGQLSGGRLAFDAAVS